MRNNFNTNIFKFEDTGIDEKTLLQKAKTDPAYYNILFARYYRFVIKMALKYKYTSIPLDDLIQEGFMGVLHALKKYNHNKSKFITYCHCWIRNYMYRLIQRDMNMLKLPEHLMPIMNGNGNGKIRDIDKQKTEQYINDIAAIRNSQEWKEGTEVNKNEIYDKIDAQNFLNQSQHKEILQLRFGFIDGECWKLKRIAQKYKLSRERIRQIIEAELKILRRRNNGSFFKQSSKLCK